MLQFDHIGIVAANLQTGRSHLARILQIAEWTSEIADPGNGVRLQFGRDASGICYEVLEPLGSASPVAAALRDNRAILNHVAYRVEDLDEAAEHMRAARCARTAEPRPAIAFGGQRIQFFVTPLRFIVELIEAPGHRHAFALADLTG